MSDLEDSEIVKITKKLRHKLCNIKNNHCVVVEFINKENDLQCGFIAWLDADVNNLNEIIEEQRQVPIYWPVNCTVKAKSIINNFLLTANFTKEIVIVKAQGDWSTMRQQLASLKASGRLNVSRNSRKNIKRKNPDESVKKAAKKEKIKPNPTRKKHEELFSKLKSKKIFKITNSSEESDTEEASTSKDNNDKSKPQSTEYEIDQDQSESSDVEDPNDQGTENNSSLDNVVPSLISSTPIKSEHNSSLEPGIKRSFPLTKLIMQNLSTKSVSAFVSGLVDNFFEIEYLAAHSPTGKASNANKNMIPKPALHPPTVKHIRVCVDKVFGSTKDIPGKVTRALSDKISSARAALKEKKTPTIQ